MNTDIITDAIPGAAGAVAGGTGVAWLTKVLLGRMITQNDKRHDHHARKIDASLQKLNDQATKIAVLESHLEDARRLRIDLEQRFASLRGEYEAKFEAVIDEVQNLRRDVWVAHERLRSLAAGDLEISKIQAPPVVRRR